MAPTRRQIPDLTATMCDFAQLDAAALGQIRKTTEDPPRVSIYDLIRAVARVKNPHDAWGALVGSHPEVLGETEYLHKFPGSGQRDTPVTDARGAVEIIMLLPGRAAASFRKEAAGVVVRFLGGDLTLVEEIAANRLAQEQLPDSHPARLFGQAVESEQTKRLREELQTIELQGQLKRARVENASSAITTGFRAMEQLGIPPTERDRLMARDILSTAIFFSDGAAAADAAPPTDREICIRQFLLERGLRPQGLDIRVGMRAKKLYLEEHPEYTFPKKDIRCNGQVLPANVWYESQRAYLKRAVEELGIA